MRLTGDAKLLRIFVGESDKIGHRPVYEVLLQKARSMGLSGATVLRGVAGFGAGSIIHRAKLLELSEDLPFVLEVVDSDEKIREFVAVADQLFEESGCGGLITMEKVEIIKHTHPRSGDQQ